MLIRETSIPDVLILEPQVHGDERGYFMEAFRASHFQNRMINLDFVQDNQSLSVQGTLRGLHYQLEYPQGKLARIISGEVFDVAVDIRRSSSTFGQWVGVVLSAQNKRQLWIPPGFAHGFYVLSETAELLYKCTEYYHPEDDHSIAWDDVEIGIKWPLASNEPLLSKKDENALSLAESPLFP